MQNSPGYTGSVNHIFNKHLSLASVPQLQQKPSKTCLPLVEFIKKYSFRYVVSSRLIYHPPEKVDIPVIWSKMGRSVSQQRLVKADKPTDPGTVDALAHLVLCRVLAHGPHHPQQLLGGDGPTPVLPGDQDQGHYPRAEKTTVAQFSLDVVSRVYFLPSQQLWEQFVRSIDQG